MDRLCHHVEFSFGVCVLVPISCYSCYLPAPILCAIVPPKCYFLTYYFCQLLAPPFFLYLDSEINAQKANSPAENALTTVKLKLVDEKGKR